MRPGRTITRIIVPLGFALVLYASGGAHLVAAQTGTGSNQRACLNGSGQACQELGLTEYRARNYVDALRWFKRGCDASYMLSCTMVGHSLRELGKGKEARNAFAYACREGRAYAEGSRDACLYAGLLAKDDGELELAREFFRYGCEHGQYGEVCYYAGLSEKEAGNDEAAERIWRDYCKHGGDYIHCAELSLEWCKQGDEMACWARGRVDAALAIAGCLREQRPRPPSSDKRPRIVTTNGQSQLVLPDSFLRAVKRDYPTLRIPENRDMTGFWKYLKDEGAHFPFLAWGFFNDDNLTDIVIILVSDTHWKWAIYHQKPDGDFEYAYPTFFTGLISNKEVGGPQDELLSKACRRRLDVVVSSRLEVSSSVTFWEDGEYRAISSGE